MRWPMRRSVRDLAEEVDAALGLLAEARGLEAATLDTLALAREDVRKAEEAVKKARDALFEEHPDLAPKGWGTPAIQNKETPVIDPSNPALLPGQDPSKFEPVEVDDSDDPRFTAGAQIVSPSDTDDLPPIVWGEHDD